MANVQKFTRAKITGGSLTRHFERDTDEFGNYHQWGNQEIDPSRSHLNFNLAPEREEGQMAFIEKRLGEVKCHKREDVNVMCSWVITAPKNMPEDEHDLFFREAYGFLNEKYGEGTDKNVVSAYVHMDETTPHMHYAFIPVVHDEKKNIDKVSAKEALGWSEKGLANFHVELDERMTAVFGRDIGVRNEATAEGNRTVEELKQKTEIKTLQAEIENLGSILDEKRQALMNDYESKKDVLNGRLRSLDAKLKSVEGEILEVDKIKAMKPEYVKFSAKSKLAVPVEDFVNLRKTALQRAELDIETRKTQKENKSLKTKIEGLTQEKNVLENKLDKLSRGPGFAERMELAKLKSQLQNVPKLELAEFIAKHALDISLRQKEKHER